MMSGAHRKAALLLSSAVIVCAVWIAQAQQTPAPVRHSVGKSTALGTANDRFTRTHWEPGGRTNWHVHPRGQIILPQDGRVRVQNRGGPVIELVPGDEPVYTPPNVAHWHGSAPNEAGTYLATTPGGEADVTWMEEVSEQDYAGKAVPGKKAQ